MLWLLQTSHAYITVRRPTDCFHCQPSRMEVINCMTWIQHFWYQLVSIPWIQNQRDKKYLPDDLVIEILSRLPADEVLKCRRVCKNWRALTSTHQFKEKHLKHASPILFMQCRTGNPTEKYRLEFCYLDEKLKGKIQKNITKKGVCTRFMDNTSEDWPVLVDSCDGLLLFQAANPLNLKLFVCNLVTKEVVTLMKPYDNGWVSGFFFHSSTKEYRLLFARCWESGYNEYFILSLGSKSWRRLGTFRHQTYPLASVISHRNLHWVAEQVTTPCANTLLVFNSELETFKTLPHPGSQYCSKSQLCEKGLLLIKMEKDGLAFGIPFGNYMFLLVLENHEKWSWERKYEIRFDILRGLGDTLIFRKGIGNIQNNELLLIGYEGGLFRYNLHTKTIRKLQRKDKFKITHYGEMPIRSYTKSLVSLKELYGG